MSLLRLALAALLAATSLAGSQAAEPLRVFIRSGVKTHGPNQHDHPRFLGEWTKLLSERGMKVDGAMEFPSAAQLEATDVLIIYASDGMKIVGDQRVAFEKFLQRGGGFVVIHAGVVSADQHEWCKQVIGGAWRWADASLPKERQTKWLEGDVGVFWVDNEHPISRGLSNFDWKDEIYYDMDLAPDIGTLATSFHNVQIIAPQIWTYEKTWAGGQAAYRAFVSLPGHEFDVFSTPSYRTVLLRGIAWAARRPNADEFVKAEELAALRYPPGGPKPAQEAAKTFNVHPDFDLSLAADENVAEKIMSIDWDPRGRLWVVETPEYPGGRDIHKSDLRISPWRVREPEKYPVSTKESRPPRDRVSVLEDTNGDGVMDRRTVFADGLELPTSLVFYKDGVIVTQAPEILFLRDTDGDGKADKVEVLYKGWGTFDTHAVTSNLRWGPDGWVYGSVGYSSGDVTSGDGANKFGRINAGLYRFRPDGSDLEQVAAGSCNTWGCDIAPDGEIFFSTATCGEPILHVVVPEKIISRSGRSGVRAAKPIIEENKVHPARVETRQPYLQIDWVGAFTAASGGTIYNGGAWPAKWNGPSWSFFLHEPTVWLTHHEFLDPAGVSYQGRREEGRKQTHFLTSSDYWFKPIHSQVGPDGALYVVDFYNQIAVHNDTRGPAHGARNAATRPDRNHQFTRLWRLQHKQAVKLPPYQLDAKKPRELVAMLDHPNGWVRTTANRLLSEGAGRGVIDTLEQQTAEARTPFGRIGALWVLHNLGAINPQSLLRAASDPDPVLRRNAMRLAAEQDNSNVAPPLDLVRDRLNDADPRARLAAFVAGSTVAPSPEIAVLVTEAWPTLQNPHLETAALAMMANAPVLYLEAALASREPAALASLVPHLVRQIANRNSPDEARSLVIALASKPASANALKASALQALASSLRADVKPASDDTLGAALKALLGSEQTAEAVLPLIARWDFAASLGEPARGAVAKTLARLRNTALSEDERVRAAISVLGVRALDAAIVPAVAGLLGENTAPGLQRRIIAALGDCGDPVAGQRMLAAMPGMDLDLREAAFGQLIKRSDWSLALLETMKGGKLDPSVLGPSNLHRLRTHADTTVSKRANEVIDDLRGPEQKEKEAIVAKLRPEVVKAGDISNGAKLYTANCAPCHKYKTEGADFAPNLTGMGAHGPEDLLVHIIDPNRVVEPNFIAVSIETKDDLSYDGVVLRENSSVVVVRNQTAETEIRKDNIATRRSTGRSLMPEGFEVLGAEGVRDLLAFLCADEARFRVLDLLPVSTANTARGIYVRPENRDDAPAFTRTGLVKIDDVPFDVLSPQRGPANVILLRGGEGYALTMPKQVDIKVGVAARRIHFLGGIAGWGAQAPVPADAARTAVVITLHLAGGGTERILLRDGVEIADWIGRFDVPGSKWVPDLARRGQLRTFSKEVKSRAVIERMTLESVHEGVAPTFIGITVERAEASAAPQAAASGTRVFLTAAGSSHDFPRWWLEEDVKTLSALPGYQVAATGKPDEVGAQLPGLGVLLIANNTPFSDASNRKAIMKFAEDGHGLVLLHAGLWYNWADWPEYNRILCGGGSRGHDNLGEFEVKVTAPDHPLMKGVPATFTIKDELYWFETDPQGSAIEVLATAHSKSKNKDFPMVFIVKHPKARIAAVVPGHDGDAHRHPAYIQLLRNATRWAAGEKP
jgi:putative membrane-bound dehydrogenase-like protein